MGNKSTTSLKSSRINSTATKRAITGTCGSVETGSHFQTSADSQIAGIVSTEMKNHPTSSRASGHKGDNLSTCSDTDPLAAANIASTVVGGISGGVSEINTIQAGRVDDETPCGVFDGRDEADWRKNPTTSGEGNQAAAAAVTDTEHCLLANYSITAATSEVNRSCVLPPLTPAAAEAEAALITDTMANGSKKKTSTNGTSAKLDSSRTCSSGTAGELAGTAPLVSGEKGKDSENGVAGGETIVVTRTKSVKVKKVHEGTQSGLKNGHEKPTTSTSSGNPLLLELLQKMF